MSTSHYPESRIWLALRFSNLPLQVLESEAPTMHGDSAVKAIVVTEKKHVIYVNETARVAGVHYGCDVTTAQLLINCESRERKIEKEMQALTHLSSQLYQFTPYIQTYHCEYFPHSGLLLEISTCLKLFGGIRELTNKIFNFLKTTAYTFEYALAYTAKGAWLLSFDPCEITGKETKTLIDSRLQKLSIQLLHDFPSVVDALKKTGFKSLGDIARQIDAQNITSIKKRFGAAFSEYLCELFGIEQNFQQASMFEKPLTVYKPIEFFSENIQFDYPIAQSDQLHYPIEYLLQNLSCYLRKRQQECQKIEWVMADIYHNQFVLPVTSDSAESHWELFYDLTLIQLDSRELPFEVDSLTLTCRTANVAQNRSQFLSFDNSRKSRVGARNFTITIAKLKARLGDAAIFKLSYCDALFPEASNAFIPVNEICTQKLPDIHKKALRPAWLLPEPILITQRKQGLYWRGRLTLIVGPERIRSSWWGQAIARDYFMAQRHDYVRLWVFLDLRQKQWYVHGIFG
ncbi:MAG: DNA polymerase Y family protein [Moraxellaceae bacterium]|nr:MAG: DNA polymerase Y family protein [Moraxellaceae bacterium]